MAELGEESTTVSANRGSFAAICFTLRPDSHPRPIFALLFDARSIFLTESLRSTYFLCKPLFFSLYLSLFSLSYRYKL